MIDDRVLPLTPIIVLVEIVDGDTLKMRKEEEMVIDLEVEVVFGRMNGIILEEIVDMMVDILEMIEIGMIHILVIEIERGIDLGIGIDLDPEADTGGIEMMMINIG